MIDVKIANLETQKDMLGTKSRNHQWFEMNNEVDAGMRNFVGRYIKTQLHMVSGRRMGPDGNIKDFILHSKLPTDHDPMLVNGFWHYNSEVLHLYEGIDNKVAFERMNRSLIERGLLIEYDPTVTYVWKSAGVKRDERGETYGLGIELIILEKEIAPLPANTRLILT